MIVKVKFIRECAGAYVSTCSQWCVEKKLNGKWEAFQPFKPNRIGIYKTYKEAKAEIQKLADKLSF
jgi:hypothetical protein